MRTMLFTFLFMIIQLTFAQDVQKATQAEYVCLPCGNSCDKTVYHQPGQCEHCNMPLVKKSSVVFGEIKPSEICRYISSHPDVVLLDVRTKEEFENRDFHQYGTLKNAINIPVHDLPSRLSELSSYKNRTIIVYCSHSQRSAQASYLLSQNGFSKVFNMSGGMHVMKDDSCKKQF